MLDVELSGPELVLFMSVLIGLAAMFGAIIFTLQTRHHGIYVHESNIQEECYRLHCINNKNESERTKFRNLKKQLKLLRARYDWALRAYILIMVQEFVVIAYAIFVLTAIASKSPFFPSLSWLIVSLLPGLASLLCHIFGDLVLARDHQRISRQWWDGIEGSQTDP